MKKNKITLLAMALFCAIGVSACSDGEDGKDGAPGEPGVPGTPGTPGAPAGSTVDTVATAADFKLTVAPADIVVVGADDFSIKFTATGKNSKGDDVPFTGLDKVALYVTNQVANATDNGAPMLWSNNALVNEFGSSMYCTPTGKATARGGAEVDACTLVEDAENPGTYTGTWEHDGNAPVVIADGDPNSMFRVMVRTYNVTDANGVSIADKLLSTPVDFIPATGEMAVSAKDSVSSAACIQCHSELMGYGDDDKRIANIGAHHNYQKVENCIACHNPAYAADQNDPEKGFNPNFNAMIHTIHAGGHLAEWGVLKGDAEEFAGVHFPAELNECKTCHDNGDQWKENVYREACVGCHVTVNFETGEGHSDFQLPQADDSQCMNCHIGNLSPEMVHRVGERDKVAEGLTFDFTDAIVTPTADPAMSTLTVKAKVTLNGQPVADDINFAEYMTNSGRGILAGTVDADGNVMGNLGMKIITDTDNTVTLSGGVITVAKDFDSALLAGNIYVTAEVQVCAEGDMVVKCTTDAGGDIEQMGVANSAPIKYFNLADPAGAIVIARMDDPNRITVDEAKCNTCHGNLTHVKGTHGATEFTQCMYCHNEYAGRSGHPVQYKSDEVDADGNAIWVTTDVTFNQRDLFGVAHRFHSGLWDARRGEPGIYRDADGELHGYPAVQTSCIECHNEGQSLFAADGGLTSGKRAIKVSTSEELYITPVAEACRSCHAHSNGAALAHFKSNGAYVQGDPATTADLPVESCATCHAEGKTYGVDKVHAGGGH